MQFVLEVAVLGCSFLNHCQGISGIKGSLGIDEANVGASSQRLLYSYELVWMIRLIRESNES